MNKILVFSHMMKTAGTSLSKQLIAHYGSKMHIVPGGLLMNDDYYNKEYFKNDFEKLNQKLNLISGHPMRPYLDFGEYEKNMVWFTFFREPTKRFVSHYLHDYKWTKHFSHNIHKVMKDSSIIEWDKFYNFSNYQTRFIAGENSFDKAVEFLESKIKWVGLTEEYEESLYSLKSHLNLKNFYFDIEKSNKNLADQEMKTNVHNKYLDFIHEKNENDIKLYKYVKDNIYPKFKIEEITKKSSSGKSKLTRNINTVSFHINRQMKFRTSEINIANLKRFYRRWYK